MNSLSVAELTTRLVKEFYRQHLYLNYQSHNIAGRGGLSLYFYSMRVSITLLICHIEKRMKPYPLGWLVCSDPLRRFM